MEELIRTIVMNFGPLGIAVLMFLENIFPPIPSELIMPLAGYVASRGEISIFIVIIAGGTGSVLGILPWYVLGRKLGREGARRMAAAHGRWLTVDPSRIDAAADGFNRHGRKSVLLGRLVPTVRTLISVPAGVAQMPFLQFVVFSMIGTFAWTTLLAGSSYLLGQAHTTVAAYVDPISTAVMAALLIGYVYRVATYKA